MKQTSCPQKKLSLDDLGRMLQRMEKHVVKTIGDLMSVISDFAAKQNAFNDKIDAAISGIADDVQTLNDKITELQNTPGEITAEDQALLDQIQTRAEEIVKKLEALDALTPPKVPTP